MQWRAWGRFSAPSVTHLGSTRAQSRAGIPIEVAKFSLASLFTLTQSGFTHTTSTLFTLYQPKTSSHFTPTVVISYWRRVLGPIRLELLLSIHLIPLLDCKIKASCCNKLESLISISHFGKMFDFTSFLMSEYEFTASGKLLFF